MSLLHQLVKTKRIKTLYIKKEPNLEERKGIPVSTR